jgi:hypothetical protein
MRFWAEIWRRSEHIQALGNFSKLIGEKSPIRRQRVKDQTPLRCHMACDWLSWFSLIINFITPDITPFFNFKIGA